MKQHIKIVDKNNRRNSRSSFPLPVVRFRMFGGSSLDFELMGWISEPAFRGRIVHQLNSAIYKKFAEHNIEIPYAKQDLYIKEFPGRMSATAHQDFENNQQP